MINGEHPKEEVKAANLIGGKNREGMIQKQRGRRDEQSKQSIQGRLSTEQTSDAQLLATVARYRHN